LNNLNYARLFHAEDVHTSDIKFPDTVISSRIRLIRNIYNIPFAYRQNHDNYCQIKSVVEKFIGESCIKGLSILEIKSLDKQTKRFLREKNIISLEMENSDNSCVIADTNEDIIILLNDSDHFKIQITRPGLQIAEAYYIAENTDNELNRFAPYAYSDKFGYITSNSSNSGMEISAILHLPVLCFTKKITDAQNIARLGRFNIEGLKQDGLKTFGGLFTISNGLTICVPETQLLDEFERITHKIIDLESEERENYFTEHGIKLEDKIFRSYGLLKYARRIGYAESIDLLSDIRLGIILSAIKNIDLYRINELMKNMQWAHLQRIANKLFNDTLEGDIFRASYLRDQL
jgi:protein arginine kinase